MAFPGETGLYAFLSRKHSRVADRKSELEQLIETAATMKGLIEDKGFLNWEEKFSSLRSLLFRLDSAKFDVETLNVELDHMRVTNTSKLNALRCRQQMQLYQLADRLHRLQAAIASALQPRFFAANCCQRVFPRCRRDAIAQQQSFFGEQMEANATRAKLVRFETENVLAELRLSMSSFLCRLLDAYKRYAYAMRHRTHYIEVAEAMKRFTKQSGDVGGSGDAAAPKESTTRVFYDESSSSSDDPAAGPDEEDLPDIASFFLAKKMNFPDPPKIKL